MGTIGPDAAGPTIAMRGLNAEDCSVYNLAPWWVDYTWTYAPHGLDSKRYWEGYPNLPDSDAVLDCTVCHDPHGSYTATNTLGNPYMIRDFVDGSSFIDDGNRPTPSTWVATPGTSGSVVVTISGTSVDWGSSGSLCIKCHASWHSYCNGCQSCHGYGQSWDGSDWGTGENESTYCAINPVTTSSSFGASSVHDDNSGQSCSECHEAHAQ